MLRDDTIFALATPDQPAALAVIRTSGPAAFDLAATLGADQLRDRCAVRRDLTFDGLTVPATLYAFRGPRSHTGEDVVEYLLPGSPPLVSMLLKVLANLGGRPAEPGEFSARAFFNAKLTLDAAEGVAASISATNDAGLAAAGRLRGGELSRRLAGPLDALADLAALCELALDFADEDVTVLAPADAEYRIDAISADLRRLVAESPRLERLGRPPTIALVGRANAGKSTLLNALCGTERAVASPVAGTTRDALTADVDLPAGRATLVDLAGLEPEALHALDAAAAGVARRAAAEADVLVLLRADDRDDPLLPRAPDLIVGTKSDLASLLQQAGSGPDAQTATRQPHLRVSARTGANINALKSRMSDLAFARATGDALALNARHVAALRESLDSLADARASTHTPEFLAHDLRRALDALGQVLGLVTPDDLLGRVFSRFCIGK